MGPGVMAPQAPPQPQELFKSIVQIGQQIDAMLKSFAQAMPNGAKLFAQATQLIQQGIAQEMAASGAAEPTATSPTAAGPEFPGGGFTGSRA